jgi:hypothetical protein
MTQTLFEENLSDVIRCQGIDNEDTGHANYHLGLFHHKAADSLSSHYHLKLSESYYKEASRLFRKHYGQDHQMTLHATANLSSVSIALEQMENHH